MKVLGKKSSKSDRALPRFPELSELSVLEVAKLASHAELVDHRQRQKRTRDSAEKCAIAMGVSPATFYRRAARYKATGRVESMGRPRTSGGRGKSRLHPEVEAIIQKALRHFLRRKKRWNVVDLVADVEKALKERPDLPRPHDDTIRNRFKALL